MTHWTVTETWPKEDMRVPLEQPSDVERMDLVVWRAREVGLSAVTFVVDDRAPGSSVAAVLAGARRHRSGRSPEVLVALETRVADADGRLSLATVPPGVDRLYATLDRLPNGSGSYTAMELREAFEEGRTSALDIIQRTVDVLRATVRRNPGVVLSRPFALLGTVGIPEDWMGEAELESLAWDAVAGGASLQVDEWDRSPRADVVETFTRAGVPVLFGTGTRDTEGVGAYDYVRRLVDRLPVLVERFAAREPGPAPQPQLVRGRA